ncbi:UNVERIFIED_CONTAM: hypothetical protein FKN15_042318 [Acipenser sinensis]
MEANSSQSAVESGGDHASTAGAGALERSEINSPFPQPKQRSLRVVYVLNDGLKAVQANSPESGALQCLQRACDAESAILATVTFGTLDFGETSHWGISLEGIKRLHLIIQGLPLIIGDIAVVDMSDVFRQPSLFYHLGVRESFDMANNVILYHDTDPDTAQSLKVRLLSQHFH